MIPSGVTHSVVVLTESTANKAYQFNKVQLFVQLWSSQSRTWYRQQDNHLHLPKPFDQLPACHTKQKRPHQEQRGRLHRSLVCFAGLEVLHPSSLTSDRAWAQRILLLMFRTQTEEKLTAESERWIQIRAWPYKQKQNHDRVISEKRIDEKPIQLSGSFNQFHSKFTFEWFAWHAYDPVIVWKFTTGNALSSRA